MRFLANIAMVLSLGLLAARAVDAQSTAATVNIRCTGGDYLEAQLALREVPSSPPEARRLRGFLIKAPGGWNRLTYDILVELERLKSWGVPRLNVCGISFYTTDSAGEVRAALFGELNKPCFPVRSNAEVTLAVQGPKPPPGQFQNIHTCSFGKFALGAQSKEATAVPAD